MNPSCVTKSVLGSSIGLILGLLLGHLYYAPRIKMLNRELNSYSLVSPLNQDYDLLRSGHLEASLLKKVRFDLLNALCMRALLTRDQQGQVLRIAHLIRDTRIIKESLVANAPFANSLSDALSVTTAPNRSARRDITSKVCHAYLSGNSKVLQLQP